MIQQNIIRTNQTKPKQNKTYGEDECDEAGEAGADLLLCEELALLHEQVLEALHLLADDVALLEHAQDLRAGKGTRRRKVTSGRPEGGGARKALDTANKKKKFKQSTKTYHVEVVHKEDSSVLRVHQQARQSLQQRCAQK